MTIPTYKVAPSLDYEAIEQHRPRLMRQAMRLVRDHGTAEDLVQECLFRAWKSREQFQGISSLHTWLYRILLNCAFNHFKRCKREVHFPEAKGSDSPIELPDEATPEQHLIAKQRAQLLLKALERLPAALSETLALRYLHDLSYEEIAATLDLPVGTVRSRLHRTNRALGIG